MQEALTVPDLENRTPRILCEAVALFSRHQRNSNSRSVFIIVTDEDPHYDNNCYKYERKNANIFPKIKTEIRFPVERRRPKEGGGYFWIPHWYWKEVPQSFSCQRNGKKILDDYTYPNSQEFRKTPKSLSSCMVQTRDKGDFQYEPEMTVTNWLSQTQVLLQGEERARYLEVNNQLKQLLGRAGQSQLFVGLFTIMDERNLKNSDQEVAKNLFRFIDKNIPEERIYKQSILNSDYDHFIDQVINFNNLAKNNRVSLTKLYDQLEVSDELVVTGVKVTALNGERVSLRVEDYTLQGQALTLNNDQIDLRQGAELEVLYHIVEKDN